MRSLRRRLFLARRYAAVELPSEIAGCGNRFIGGVSGRTGTSWLSRLVRSAIDGQAVALGENGVFVLGAFRSAPFDLYQVTPGTEQQRLSYVKHFRRFFLRYAYDRHALYGSGVPGLRRWVPKRAVLDALDILEAEALAAMTLGECRECFGRFYSRLLTAAALVSGGTVNWVSKEPGYGRHIDELWGMIPEMRTVLLVRDGRDVALSMARKGWCGGNVIRCMDRWAHFSSMTLESMARVPDDAVMLLQYETLLGDMRGTLGAVLDFFGWKDADLEGLSAALEAPIKGNTHKWEGAIDTESLRHYDRACGDVARRLGYDA